ncbi:hypothetical protein EIN_508320, partial [Entamoeba invadens IP1]
MCRTKLYGILKNCKAFYKKFGNTLLLACFKDPVITEETELFLYWSTTNLTTYLNRGKNYYKKLDIYGIIARGSISGNPILTTCKTGTFTSASKNKCAKVEIVEAKTNKTEQIQETLNSLILKELPYLTLKDSKKLDD